MDWIFVRTTRNTPGRSGTRGGRGILLRRGTRRRRRRRSPSILCQGAEEIGGAEGSEDKILLLLSLEADEPKGGGNKETQTGFVFFDGALAVIRRKTAEKGVSKRVSAKRTSWKKRSEKGKTARTQGNPSFPVASQFGPERGLSRKRDVLRPIQSVGGDSRERGRP